MRSTLFMLVALIGLLATGFSQEEPLNIVIFGAHPDDCDSDAGGTALLYSTMGHRVKFVSLTNGDAGHYTLGREELAKIRQAEAQEAGKRFGVTYKVLDNHDGELVPSLENRLQVIREIRDWNADIVIAPRPNDYHPDHRYTGVLVQDAAYMVIVPGLAPESAPLQKNPVFLYSADHFQKPNPFEPEIAIDIGPVFDQKIAAMAAHESQYFDWLPWTAGKLREVPEDAAGRLEYLASWRPDTPNEAVRKSLERWYGPRAATIEHAEAFEICEYGKQPTEEELYRLFPMLGK